MKKGAEAPKGGFRDQVQLMRHAHSGRSTAYPWMGSFEGANTADFSVRWDAPGFENPA